MKKTSQNPDKQGNNKSFNDAKWKPGQSGNKEGRPPAAKCIPDLLRKFGALKCPDDFTKRFERLFPEVKDLTLSDAVILKVYEQALEGEAWAINFIAERTEGKVAQTLQGVDEGPISVSVNFTKA